MLPLVILDVQDAIDQPVWTDKNNPHYLDVICKLLAHWRAENRPVIHVKHNEATPTSSYHIHGPWNAIKQEVVPLPDEPVITKEQNCAFINTDLDKTLKEIGASGFVLTGVVIHNSMDATIRAGKALRYRIILPRDATTAVPVRSPSGESWDARTVFEMTLAILGSEYADVTHSSELLK